MCGIVGTREAFFSKTKRFCSVSCSRSYSSNSKKASILARLQVRGSHLKRPFLGPRVLRQEQPTNWWQGAKRAWGGPCLYPSEDVNCLVFIMISNFRGQRDLFMELINLQVPGGAFTSFPTLGTVSFKQKCPWSLHHTFINVLKGNWEPATGSSAIVGLDGWCLISDSMS